MTGEITMGTLCKDVVTDFKGTVIARAEYLYATPQLLPAAKTENNDADERWIEESRIVPCEPRPPGFGVDPP